MRQPEQYYLASTSDKELWVTDSPIIFLGDFCNPYNDDNKSFLSNEPIKGLQYTKETYLEAMSFSASTYENILPQIGKWLDEFHGESHSTRYWEIIIGPFLIWYIENLYEKYRRISKAIELFPYLKTKRLKENMFITPNDTLDYINLSPQDDLWNLQLSTQIIQYFKNEQFFEDTRSLNKINYTEKQPSDDTNVHFNSDLRNIIKRFLLGLNIHASIITYLPILSLRRRIEFAVRSGFFIWPYFNRQLNIEYDYARDISARMTLKNIPANDSFTGMVFETLCFNLPLIFIEGYRKLKSMSTNIASSTPKLIVSDIGWYFDELFKIWAANEMEKGSKLVCVQHGGAYGSGLYSSSERHEKTIADYFISWGWKDSEKVIPLPSLKLEKIKKVKYERNTRVLWVSTCFPRYGGQSCIDMSSYLTNQLRFAKNLQEKISHFLVLRLPFTDYGWGVESFWRTNVSHLQIESATNGSSFYQSLINCRIFVTDNNSTALFQAMAYNVPTILFWDTNKDIIRETVSPLYEELKNVGIFHSSPESAALHLNSVYNEISRWWKSDEVQYARSEFCRKLVNIDDHLVTTWAKALKSLLV